MTDLYDQRIDAMHMIERHEGLTSRGKKAREKRQSERLFAQYFRNIERLAAYKRKRAEALRRKSVE